MANIDFVRVYKGFFDEDLVDVIYITNGKKRYRTFEKMPKTAMKWIEGKTGKEQYDKLYGKEIIYK